MTTGGCGEIRFDFVLHQVHFTYLPWTQWCYRRSDQKVKESNKRKSDTRNTLIVSGKFCAQRRTVWKRILESHIRVNWTSFSVSGISVCVRIYQPRGWNRGRWVVKRQKWICGTKNTTVNLCPVYGSSETRSRSRRAKDLRKFRNRNRVEESHCRYVKTRDVTNNQNKKRILVDDFTFLNSSLH